MGRPAAATAVDSDLGNRLDSLGRQIGYGGGLRPRRFQILAVILIVLGFWLLLTFGRAVGQLNDATQREMAAAAETRALQAQLESGRRELMLVQTDAFQAMQARALGMGENGEQVFALTADAPPPPQIVPLGATSASATSSSPLDSWLQMLFGR
jgi:cell division protein FtsB